MPIFTFRNAKIYYEERGAGEPLLLIGGLTTNHKVWSSMVDLLSPYFRLILPDNRGAGLSTQSDQRLTIEEMADDLFHLLLHLKIEKSFIVGHSMGGMIAQALLIKYQERFRKAVIAGSAAKLPLHAMLHIKSVAKLMKLGLPFETLVDVVFPWIYDNFLLADEKKFNAEVQRIKTDNSPQSYVGYLSQIQAIDQFDFVDEVDKIKIKTLVLCGEDDILIPQKISLEQFKKIPHATYKSLSHCGHMMHREQPQQFSQAIIDFFVK